MLRLGWRPNRRCKKDANITITLDTYHVVPGMGDQTARAMEEALDDEDPLEDGTS